MRRLAIAIRAWQDCLRGVTGDSAVDTMDTTSSTPQLPHKLGGTPALQAIRHELHITNQIMHLQPPVEMARCDLIAQLHNWISIVTALPRIQSSRYQVDMSGFFSEAPFCLSLLPSSYPPFFPLSPSLLQVGLVELSPTEATYRSLLGKLMEHDSEPLVEAYGAIEGLLGSVQSYVKVHMGLYGVYMYSLW